MPEASWPGVFSAPCGTLAKGPDLAAQTRACGVTSIKTQRKAVSSLMLLEGFAGVLQGASGPA